MAIALVVYFGQSTITAASSHETPVMPATNWSSNVSAIEPSSVSTPAAADKINNSTETPTDTALPGDRQGSARSGGPPSGMSMPPGGMPPGGKPPSDWKPPSGGAMPSGTPPSGTNGATASATPSVAAGKMSGGTSGGLSGGTSGMGSLFGSSGGSAFGSKATTKPSSSGSGLSLYNYASSAKPNMTSLFGHS